ncbi:C-4 methylsterol oxidase [Aureococcus anophagefferens]|nr:C-4 methylsterol oxidase [Aureococcus anophagefferens]
MPMPTRAAWRSVLWDVAATLSVPLGIKLAMESTEYQFFASGVNHMCVWCRWGSLGNSDCYANWTALWRDIRAAGPVGDRRSSSAAAVVHLGVFWTYCLALSVLDLWGPAWVVKYKALPHIHKIHHQFTHPVGFVALYAHPLEHALEPAPGRRGRARHQVHCFLFWVWITLGISTMAPKSRRRSELDRGEWVFVEDAAEAWVLGKVEARSAGDVTVLVGGERKVIKLRKDGGNVADSGTSLNEDIENLVDLDSFTEGSILHHA